MPPNSVVRSAHRLFSEPDIYLARDYTDLGENNQAIALFEKSVGSGDILANEIPIDPEMDPLRSDPRFLELARRVQAPIRH